MILSRLIWPQVYRLSDGTRVIHAFYHTIRGEVTDRNGKKGLLKTTEISNICDRVEGEYLNSAPSAAVTCSECNRILHG